MVDRYRVAWDPDARADLLEIVSFIAEDNPVAARRVAGRLTSAAGSLNSQPRRGRKVPELAEFPELADLATTVEVRELIVKPWRLTYVIEGRQVRIVAVVDSRRDMVAWLDRHLIRFTPGGSR